MDKDNTIKEIIIVVLATIILSITFLWPEIKNLDSFLTISIGFLLAISLNLIVKKVTAYRLEANVTTKFWSMYRFGLAERRHLKKALPMVWLPPLLAMISRGAIAWLPILEFDITPRTERIAKRHGLYRFSQMTEWHVALIVFWGIISNLALYVLLRMFGLGEIGVISLYYALWSIVPFSNLDGSKLFFGNRKLWIIAGVLALVAFVWQTTLF